MSEIGLTHNVLVMYKLQIHHIAIYACSVCATISMMENNGQVEK